AAGHAAPPTSTNGSPAPRRAFAPRALASLPSLARRPGQAPPLADERGRVPVLVRLGPGDDARALGMLEVAPGIASRRVPYDELDAFVAAHAARRPWVSPPLRPVLDISANTWTRADVVHTDASRPLAG